MFVEPSLLSNIVTDVTLREGSQQNCDLRGASLERKLEIFDALVRAGSRCVEVTAFAPGEWFSDAEQLASAAVERRSGAELRALYFNTRGLETLRKHSGLRQEGIFHTAVTDKYRRENYRQDSESDAGSKLLRMMDAFQRNGVNFDTLVLSTAWGEQGAPVTAADAVGFAARLLAPAARAGKLPRRITLADTVGNASPDALLAHFEAFRREWPAAVLCAHLHPPLAAAEASVEAALAGGAREFEAAWGGVGGSPFAEHPGGNLDIRVLIRVWNKHRVQHGYSAPAVNALIEKLSGAIERRVAEIPIES